MTSEKVSPPKSVIVRSSWGSFQVYPATLEVAKELVEEHVVALGNALAPVQRLDEIKKKFSSHPDDMSIPYLVDDSVVLRAFKDLTSLKTGEPSRALYRVLCEGPLEKDAKADVTKAHRDELVVWAFEHGFKLDGGSSRVLNEAQPEKSLSFLKGLVTRAKGHSIEYVPSEELDRAHELNQLLRGDWNPTAKIENVVQRYLTFLNDWSHRDEKYELGTFSERA